MLKEQTIPGMRLSRDWLTMFVVAGQVPIDPYLVAEIARSLQIILRNSSSFQAVDTSITLDEEQNSGTIAICCVPKKTLEKNGQT
jgi:hypothetical protein